jgi:hypothetical protein
MWWWLGVWVLLLCVSLWLDGRRRTQAVLRDWELVLTPKAQALMEQKKAHIEGELALVDWAYEQARHAQDVGRTKDAMRLLDEGCRLIEDYCPSMIRSLAALSVLSRMAAAVAPAPPLRVRGLQLRQLEGIALLNQFIHQFLISTGERFRIRLYFLGRAFQTLLGVVMRATQRAKQTRPAEPEWHQLEAARHDVRALSDEWLESFRILLTSLAAERR